MWTERSFFSMCGKQQKCHGNYCFPEKILLLLLLCFSSRCQQKQTGWKWWVSLLSRRLPWAISVSRTVRFPPPPLGGLGGHQVICVKNIKWQRKSIVVEKTHSEIHRLTLQGVTLYINIYLLFCIKYIHIYVAVPVRVSVSEWCLRMWRYFNVIVQTAVHHGTG